MKKLKPLATPKLTKPIKHTPSGTKARKSSAVSPQTKVPKGAAGSPELKATQKMFGVTKAPKAKKMLNAEKKYKNKVRYDYGTLS